VVSISQQDLENGEIFEVKMTDGCKGKLSLKEILLPGKMKRINSDLVLKVGKIGYPLVFTNSKELRDIIVDPKISSIERVGS